MLKLGRNPRKFNPRIPHLSSFVTKMRAMAPAPSSDWTSPLPADLGMMLNDQLGCCTIAGEYHGLQVWTANSNPPIDTEPDENVKVVYEQACGYNPGDPSTDQGGAEQDVLTYWLNQGIPVLPSVGSTGTASNSLSGFFEVDPRNLNDIRWTVNDCGFAYIGLQMPVYIMQNPSKIWDEPNTGDDSSVDGGHCVILPASLQTGNFKHITWGGINQMTPGFFSRSCDEAYGLVDADWLNSTGKTPGGRSLDELMIQMQALKEG